VDARISPPRLKARRARPPRYLDDQVSEVGASAGSARALSRGRLRDFIPRSPNRQSSRYRRRPDQRREVATMPFSSRQVLRASSSIGSGSPYVSHIEDDDARSQASLHYHLQWSSVRAESIK
jgi:hypothetical protein